MTLTFGELGPVRQELGVQKVSPCLGCMQMHRHRTPVSPGNSTSNTECPCPLWNACDTSLTPARIPAGAHCLLSLAGSWAQPPLPGETDGDHISPSLCHLKMVGPRVGPIPSPGWMVGLSVPQRWMANTPGGPEGPSTASMGRGSPSPAPRAMASWVPGTQWAHTARLASGKQLLCILFFP